MNKRHTLNQIWTPKIQYLNIVELWYRSRITNAVKRQPTDKLIKLSHGEL